MFSSKQSSCPSITVSPVMIVASKLGWGHLTNDSLLTSHVTLSYSKGCGGLNLKSPVGAFPYRIPVEVKLVSFLNQ